jgi:hypothetical protein
MMWIETIVAVVVRAVAALVVILGMPAAGANPLGSMSEQWMAGYKVDSR